VPAPLVQTATYTFADSAEIIAHTNGEHPRPEREEYGRYGNPTTRALELRLAALDGAADAVTFASGMGAVTTSILAHVRHGDHVVLFADCYRMTREFVGGTLDRFGVSATLVPPSDLAAMRAALRPTTRLVVCEAPSNPYLRCADLASIAATCSAAGVRTLVDATFATPIHSRPAELGIDLVVHSATKYLAGHHDVLGGVVTGAKEHTDPIRDLRGVLGNVLDAHAAFLVARGLKTLALRMRQHSATALAVARFLEGSPAVERVHYPGLASHPDHAVASAQMQGGFGGVVSFVVRGGLDGARRVVDRAKLAKIAPSLGGPETLIEQPAVMSFYAMTPEERRDAGIEDGLVRLAVGLEETDDVIADLREALA
jgi:cystathionine gamma-synthase